MPGLAAGLGLDSGTNKSLKYPLSNSTPIHVFANSSWMQPAKMPLCITATFFISQSKETEFRVGGCICSASKIHLHAYWLQGTLFKFFLPNWKVRCGGWRWRKHGVWTPIQFAFGLLFSLPLGPPLVADFFKGNFLKKHALPAHLY